MVNYRVDDLDALLDELKQAGVQIDPHREDCDYRALRLDYTIQMGTGLSCGSRLWEPPKEK
jgi:hypothetical protein